MLTLLHACAQLKWEAPDVEGLVYFLVREKGFSCVLSSLSSELYPLASDLLHRRELICLCAACSEERVRKGADKLKARLSAKQQGRLDGFFTVAPKEGAGTKRKVRPLSPSLCARRCRPRELTCAGSPRRPCSQADDKKDSKGKKAKTDAKGKGTKATKKK